MTPPESVQRAQPATWPSETQHVQAETLYLVRVRHGHSDADLIGTALMMLGCAVLLTAVAVCCGWF